MAVDKVAVDQRGYSRLREALAFGAANLGLAIETRAKANAPVRGGHRSFAPGGPVGGTLRRSIHSAAFLDGRQMAGPREDENGRQVPNYATDGIAAVVGTNTNYGEYVHNGTSRMAARPFISEALMDTKGEAQQLVEAGVRRRLGGL